MQDISLQNFKDDICNIKEYINHINLVNKIEISNRDSNIEPLKEFCQHIHRFSQDKRIFEYKAIVISLYGILETYINYWVQEHIELLPRLISNYNKLPEKIKKNHFDLSIRLISFISENRFSKYEHLQKEDILIKLSSCLKKTSPYTLNSEAFAPFSGNLKHQKIMDAFKCLDIDLSGSLKTNPAFKDFLVKKYGHNIDNRGKELFSIIDDLVTRRNDISHGIHVDNILNVTEFYDYLEFLEYYGKAIFETIREKEIEYESRHLFEKIDNIKGIFKQGSILCFEVENNDIKVGDYIIVEANNRFIKKPILNIEINKKSFKNKDISVKTDVGVDLGNGITKNQVFYIKKYNQKI